MSKFTLSLIILFSFIVSSSFGATFTSNVGGGSGSWFAPGSWTFSNPDADGIPDSDDTVSIKSGDEITYNADIDIRNLSVNGPAGTLRCNGSSGVTADIFGDYTVNGTHSGNGSVRFVGSGTMIDGTGTFSSSGVWRFAADRTIAATAVISRSTRLLVNNNITVTNNGTITCLSNITAVGANSAWTQGDNSTLNANLSIFGGGNGTFTASATGNLVNIERPLADFSIVTPAASSFFHLTVQGGNTKDINADLIILGDLTIGNNTNFDMETFDIDLRGDWINLGGDALNGDVITFGGTGVQTISTTAATETFPTEVVVDVNSITTLADDIQINDDFTLNGELDLSASDFEIAITGNWTTGAAGTLTHQEGNVRFNGSALQTVDGSTAWWNFITDNTSGVDVNSGTQTLINTLSVSANNPLDVSGATAFVLRSNTTRTGRIAALSGTAAITGDITQQRLITASGGGGYIDWGSPFANGDVLLSELDANIFVSGPGFPDGCAADSSGCFTSVKLYWSNSNPQEYRDLNGMTSPLFRTRGYSVWMGDDADINVMNSDTTINVDGTVGGSSNITKTIFPNWNMIANPYCSEIDFDALSATFSSSIGDYYYAHDVNVAGNFAWYDALSGSAMPGSAINSDGSVASSQGFWLFSSAASNRSITWTQSLKVNTNAGFIKSQPNPSIAGLFDLNLTSNINHYSCRSSIRFEDEADNTFDMRDIPYLKSPTPGAPALTFLTEDGKNVRVNTLNDFEEEIVVPVVVNVQIPGFYNIEVFQFKEMMSYDCIYITDEETGKVFDLKSTSKIKFEIATANVDDTRFTLHMKKSAYNCIAEMNNVVRSEQMETSNGVSIAPLRNGADVTLQFQSMENVTISVTNLLGQDVIAKRNVNSSNTIESIRVPAHVKGIHFIVVETSNERYTEKVYFQ
jgi:hypothetical protein